MGKLTLVFKNAYSGDTRAKKRDYHEVRGMTGCGGKSGVVIGMENTGASGFLALDLEDGHMFAIQISSAVRVGFVCCLYVCHHLQ